MNQPDLQPLTTNTPSLPSFASLRSRNLSILYEIGADKSPKGFIDTKIAPLCNLINHHDEYVTTSSCSGRVALFDPGIAHDVDTDYHEKQAQAMKSTELSGKGRGQWRFVTHDILPDLGTRLVSALEEVGKDHASTSSSERMLTLKYEPPLLHIAAASLSAGQKLLRLFKSVCRESGLMVTDERVTVEVRTMGTALCIPIIINTCDPSNFDLSPSKEYLLSLAETMNERMARNEELLARLHKSIKEELFCAKESSHQDDAYEVELHPLPDLNLWKAAAVVMTFGDNQSSDLDVFVFGGQGIGPTGGTTSQRWDGVFTLARRRGIWSDSWNRMKLTEPGEEKINMTTSAGTFRVKIVRNFGCREGHSACILPSLSKYYDQPGAAVIFGGRTGGPQSPANSVFLFTSKGCKGMMCEPCDVRGSPPSERYGHSMTALQNCGHCNQQIEGDPLVLVAGGIGIGNDGSSQTLSSVYILSRCEVSGSDEHHFLWEQMLDMQVPRAYHIAVRVSSECQNSVLIFGGILHSNDPFDILSDEHVPRCELLVCNSVKALAFCSKLTLPRLFGGTGIEVQNIPGSNTILVAGGVQSESQSSNDDNGVIRILQFNSSNNTIEPVKSSSVGNLGVCVHHCLVQLSDANQEEPSPGVLSAILVGGGVPSFSFGQSYAK